MLADRDGEYGGSDQHAHVARILDCPPARGADVEPLVRHRRQCSLPTSIALGFGVAVRLLAHRIAADMVRTGSAVSVVGAGGGAGSAWRHDSQREWGRLRS